MLKADCKACIYMHVVCVLWEGIFSIYSIIRNGILSRITASLIQEIAVLASVARVISSCGGTVTLRCPAGLRTQARWQEEEDNVNWADMGSIRPPFSPSPCLMMNLCCYQYHRPAPLSTGLFECRINEQKRWSQVI